MSSDALRFFAKKISRGHRATKRVWGSSRSSHAEIRSRQQLAKDILQNASSVPSQWSSWRLQAMPGTRTKTAIPACGAPVHPHQFSELLCPRLRARWSNGVTFTVLAGRRTGAR
jgi:hypothetical protein